MIKSQSKGNVIAKGKPRNKSAQQTKIIYKKTIGKRAKQSLGLKQSKPETRLNRNAVYLPEFKDYDPLWHIQRKNQIILFG